MKSCIIYFVKYPEPGKVKTRLAAGSSPELAAAFYRAFAREKLEELDAGCNADVLVFFTPASRGEDMPDWLGPDRTYLPQEGMDLGERMANAFQAAYARGYDRAALVGSDIPGLRPEILSEGLDALEPDTAILGPAKDGGYYLIGFHRDGFVPEAFSGMTWSTPGVIDETADKLKGTGMRLMKLPILADIDTAADLADMAESLQGETLEAARELLRPCFSSREMK